MSLNATLSKNSKANGFELRLHEQVDKRVWSFLCNEMGMNWIYSKTEKTADGKRQVILYRSYDLSKPQNKRACVKYNPERAYEILLEKTTEAVAESKKTAKKTAKKSEPKTEEKPAAKKSKSLTKAQLEERLAYLESILANAQIDF